MTDLDVVVQRHLGADDRVGADATPARPGCAVGSTRRSDGYRQAGLIARARLPSGAGRFKSALQLCEALLERRARGWSSSGSRFSATMIRLACSIGRPACPAPSRPPARLHGTPAWAPSIDAVADRHVVGDADLSRQHHAAAEPRRARDRRPGPPAASARPPPTLWPIWTRLSILVPRRTIVSPKHGAIDRRVGADLDVVLDHHAAHLRDLAMAAAVEREAKAVGAEDGAGLNDRRGARAAPLRAGSRADRAPSPRRSPPPAPHGRADASRRAAPITAPALDHAQRPHRGARVDPRVAGHHRGASRRPAGVRHRSGETGRAARSAPAAGCSQPQGAAPAGPHAAAAPGRRRHATPRRRAR